MSGACDIMRELSRREFVKSSIAAGFFMASQGSALGMMERMGGGGGSVIDPPPGDVFKDPVEAQNLSTTPGIVEVNLEPRISPVYVKGIRANLFTYNGSYPGPTIRVRRGDTLNLHFKNSLPNTTEKNILGFTRNVSNIHTHGWHVSPKEPSDAAHLHLMPGEIYNYSYNLSLQEAGTLNFYHPHIHGLTAEQLWGGLAGCLVTEDGTDVLAGYETHILGLKDITLSGSSPAPYTSTMEYMHGKEGDTIMVNGQMNPVLSIRPGQVQRWRIVNLSNARFYKLSLENHIMHLIGTDGGLLDKPYPLSEIVLSTGERIDVLVKADMTSGTFRLRSLPYERTGMCSSSGQTITLMTVAYRGTPAGETLPSSINPNAARMNMDVSALPKKTFVLSMNRGRGLINGHDFDVDPYTIMSDLDTYEVWEIVNQSGMDHNFHQHVNSSQILSIKGGDPGYASLYPSIPAWKDTVLIPKMGSTTILMPVMDYDGMTMFHCHIVEHEDIGMMGMWDIKVKGGM